MKKKSLFRFLLITLIAGMFFTSCEKETGNDSVTLVTSAGVTYDLKGTKWKSYVGKDADLIANFMSENTGELLYHWVDRRKDDDVSVSFTYVINGSYGQISIRRYIDEAVPEVIPYDAEIHLIDNNTLSIAGCVFKRQ